MALTWLLLYARLLLKAVIAASHQHPAQDNLRESPGKLQGWRIRKVYETE